MVQIVQRSQLTIEASPDGWLELALADGALMLKNRIRELRKRQHMSIETLAEKCGVTHPTISRLEAGKIKLTDVYLDSISKALGVEPIELLTDVPVPRGERQQELVRLLIDLPDSATDALIASARAMSRKDDTAA